MPTYAYRCETCGDFDRILPIARYDEPQNCEKCGQVAKKLVTGCNFNLPGDDWASKNGRIAGQMAKKNRRLSASTAAQKREQPLARLVPNVGGEQVGSWGEAQKLAKEQGKDTSSYEPMIKKETTPG